MVAGIEALLTAMYSFYNTLFQPLLAAGPYVSLGFFSAVLAGLFSVIYWYMLDIERADEIKEKLSDRQEKMKEARSNGKSEKASEHMQKTMELNQRLMKLNIKPMIGTMVFVALFFPWLGATFAPSISMSPGTGQDVTPAMLANGTQETDIYSGELEYAGKTQTIIVDNSTEKPTVTVNEQEAQVGETINALGVTWEIARFGEVTGGFFSPSQEGVALKLNAQFIDLPFSIPLAGGALNWLGFYIVIAMPLTYAFRKMLGVA